MSQLIVQDLAMNQIQQIDPILLQTNGHPLKTTEKYRAIPTIEVLQHFERAGFEWNLYKKTKSRKVTGYGKHAVMLTSKALGFSRENLAQEMQFSLIFYNSHDGSSKGRLMGHIHREICSNKMVLSDAFFKTFSFIHRKDMITLEDVMEAVAIIQSQMKGLEDTILTLKDTQWTSEQSQAFAYNMALKRLAGRKVLEVNSELLLQPNRKEDSTNSAWHVVNTVQENLLSIENFKTLTYKYEVLNNETNQIEIKTGEAKRALRGLNPTVNLNQALFDEALNVLSPKLLVEAA